MITIFCNKRERERKNNRKLLAFSLLEILIVIAIVSILVGLIMTRHYKIRTGQMVEQCRANILEMAAWMETYKVSKGFYPQKDLNGGNIGSASNPNSYRCISDDPGELGKDFPGFPVNFCPLGKKAITNDQNLPVSYSYGMRIRWDEYTIKCSVHNLKATRYEHLKDQPAGFNQDWSSQGALAY